MDIIEYLINSEKKYYIETGFLICDEIDCNNHVTEYNYFICLFCDKNICEDCCTSINGENSHTFVCRECIKDENNKIRKCKICSKFHEDENPFNKCDHCEVFICEDCNDCYKLCENCSGQICENCEKNGCTKE